MKWQPVMIVLTVINVSITIFLFSQILPAKAEQHQPQSQVLRGRALEIVDSVGRIRASISILPPVVFEGKKYPETVLLRLINNKGKPLVKIAAGDSGSGLNLSDETDRGVLINAHDSGSYVKITNRRKETIIKP